MVFSFALVVLKNEWVQLGDSQGLSCSQTEPVLGYLARISGVWATDWIRWGSGVSAGLCLLCVSSKEALR